MTDYFSYNTGTDVIPSGAFRISPSQLSKFFDSTSQWYREHLLGEAPAFTGSTASELGNCVHAAAHMYFDTKSVDKQAILSYINSITNPDVDKSILRAQIKPMIETLINQFLKLNVGTHAEYFAHTLISPGVYAAGSIDMYDERKATIYDFKTTGSLDTARIPTSFPRAYWFQQMTYAYILRQQGLPVDYLKLVYITRDNTGRISEKTGKPLKDYPSECHIVTELVTQDSLDLIKGVLKLIAASVTTWQSNPELRYLLAQDYRLFSPSKPKLFT